MYEKYFKRILDILLSSLALIVLSPVMLIVAVLIKLESPGPVFFTQRRVGKDKTHFEIFKFRTMREGTPAEIPTERFQHTDQITRVGKFLRKTSLNELPQLLNIIKGEMSIIGPRPALWNQHDLIELRDRYRANRVRPGLSGLSGWAQINGRDTIDDGTKARFDGYYVRHISFCFDVRIIIGTLLTVMRNTGVVEGGTRALAQQEMAAVQDIAYPQKAVERQKLLCYFLLSSQVTNVTLFVIQAI